ncbi:MAG: lysophospholipid acyltransferase family protein, partial [Actinomycetota bacterium]
MLAFIGYKVLELVALIIPYPIAYPIARLTARLGAAAKINLYPLKKNISLVLDLDINDPRVHKTAVDVYVHWIQNVTDFLKHRLVSKEKLKKRVEIEGLENLREALKRGKGAVIFTAHIGNFEWGACRIALEFDNTWGMGMERKFKPLNNFFESKRLSKNLNTIYSNRLLNIFRILKKNGIVAIPTDWDPNKRSGPVNFFGKKAK